MVVTRREGMLLGAKVGPQLCQGDTEAHRAIRYWKVGSASSLFPLHSFLAVVVTATVGDFALFNDTPPCVKLFNLLAGI
jgi:hypothetical protein